MKALVYDGELRMMEDYPKPVPAAGEALVRVLMAGICSTDLELVKGYMGFTGVPGHEFVGIVEASPDAGRVGTRVVGEINCPCGKCEYCARGMGNHCPARSVLGILGRDGAFAEYLALPRANLHAVPEGLSDEKAVFAEPLAAAFRITEQAEIDPGESVVVLGDGRLGLLTAQVMSLVSRRLLVVGLDPAKLSLLKDMSIETALAGETGEEKFDIAVDCTGSPDGLESALSRTRPGGRVFLKTTLAQRVPVNTARIVVDEITVVGSRCGPFAPALGALEAGTVEVGPLISAVVPFADALEAFGLARKKGTLKVILKI